VFIDADGLFYFGECTIAVKARFGMWCLRQNLKTKPNANQAK